MRGYEPVLKILAINSGWWAWFQICHLCFNR